MAAALTRRFAWFLCLLSSSTAVGQQDIAVRIVKLQRHGIGIHGLETKSGTSWCVNAGCSLLATDYHVAKEGLPSKINGAKVLGVYLASGPDDYGAVWMMTTYGKWLRYNPVNDVALISLSQSLLPGTPGRMPGAGLSDRCIGQIPSDTPAFQPYRGKPAVRNDRGDGGNVGIIRSPLRPSVLPDCRKLTMAAEKRCSKPEDPAVAKFVPTCFPPVERPPALSGCKPSCAVKTAARGADELDTQSPPPRFKCRAHHDACFCSIATQVFHPSEARGPS